MITKNVTVPEDYIDTIIMEFPTIVEVPEEIIEPKVIYTDRTTWVE